MPDAPPVDDIHSFARPAEARVTHVAIDLQADFTAHVLRGAATLTLARRAEAREIVLDTRGLAIARVLDARRQPLTFRLDPEVPILGQPLVVTLPESGDEITVEYETRPDAAALQWLTPAQTAGKTHPYLYSQGQAILTRTWLPTQDSPGIRQTYSARLSVPRPLTAVMSAEMLTPEGRDVGSGMRTFEFRMDQPIPPYLIALAVGDIAFRSLGPRTGVYTEPATLNRAASELVDLERMITAAEALGGPYRWGRYDVLVLPPSFPFGGMENEGFMTYFENRIMESLYGRDRAAMLAVLGRNELTREMATLPAADTRLAIDLEGRDPDDGMTPVAYEKGASSSGSA